MSRTGLTKSTVKNNAIFSQQKHCMNSFDCTASIVVWNNPVEMVRNAIESLLSCDLNIELQVVDNSPKPVLQLELVDLPIKYHFNDCNAGYGRGHNRAIKAAAPSSRYHIILNPDVVVNKNTIEALFIFMNQHPDIGIVCPKILNKDGSIQFLNKRYPTLLNLFVRRFVPRDLHRFVRDKLDMFEMKDAGYDTIYDVEFLSGSFMFCRTEALRTVGGFDERYFLYFEDVDLCRKVQSAGYRTVFYPYVSIMHQWNRASYKSLKMTFIHIKSAVQYFNKWGWKFY